MLSGTGGDCFLWAVFSLRNVLLYWVPVLLIVGAIFSASSDRSSMQRSSRIIGPIVRFFVPRISEPDLRKVVFAARKGAHFTEYALLALVLFRAVRGTWHGGTHPWERREAVWVFLACVAVAICDETYQTLVPQRQGAVVDIVIDSSGAFFALYMIWLVGRWRKRW